MIYVSASKIANFLYCPFTFQLQAAGYEPKEPYFPAVVFGSALHEAYRLMAIGINVEEAVSIAVSSVEFVHGYTIPQDKYENLVRMLSSLPEWAIRPKATEYKFELKLSDNIMLVGYLDAITDDTIIELKAVNRRKTELPPTYMIQAQIYMYATQLKKTTFLMLDSGGHIETFFVEPIERTSVELMLHYFVEAMEQDFKPPTGLTNFACNKCAFSYICPFVKLLRQPKTQRI